MPKIVLIQPDSDFLLEPLSFPSLGLLYISSYLRKNNYSPEFFDLTGGNKLPENLKADIFGFSTQITQFNEVVELKNKLKQTNPNAVFVIGGPFPTHSPQECFDAGFDVVVVGEGEIPMLNVIKDFPSVKRRIIYAEEFVDPNEFFPDWGAINPLRYKYQLEGKRCINIMTKRGNCPFQCTFCAKPEQGKSPLRFRTAQNVLNEAKFLKEIYGFGAIAIYDDDVLINKERDKQIFIGLKELGMPYRCMTRADLATKEDLKFLKETGCAEICVGVESADPNIHEKVIKKGTTVDKNTEFVKNCNEIGLRVKAYLIIGLPSESKETIQKTKQWLSETRPNSFDVSIFTPYPGSEIYKNKINYEADWDEDSLKEYLFSGEPQYGKGVVKTPYLSPEEIFESKAELEKEFGRGFGGTTNYWGPIKEYKLNEPYLKGREKEYVLDVIESGWLSIKGKYTKLFEEKFAKLIGLKYSLAVQSGTAALHAALLALGVGKGDSVVLPNFTCGACVTSVLQCGATPAILDVEEDTFCLDANNLEKYIQQKGKPKAVMLVHIYGFPARDLEKIVEICKRENILLLEDCCEAHGAEHNGKKLGSFGDMAVFSIRSEKMIGVGEGGLILTNNKELINRATYWASRASPHRGGKDPYWDKYVYTGIGMNYLLPHLLGAVGLAQIENFEEILSKKRKVGEKYHSLLQNKEGIKLQKKIENSNPCFWLNILLFEDKTREQVRELGEKLIKRGIEIRPAFWPLGSQSIFEEYAFGSQKVGDYIFEKAIVLPSSIFLEENDCQAVNEIVDLLESEK